MNFSLQIYSEFQLNLKSIKMIRTDLLQYICKFANLQTGACVKTDTQRQRIEWRQASKPVVITTISDNISPAATVSIPVSSWTSVITNLHAKGGLEIFIYFCWFSLDKVYTKLKADWKVYFYC